MPITPPVVADGVTDNYLSIQEALYEAGDVGDVVLLPPGDVAYSRPLLINKPTSLIGDPYKRTKLFGRFGSGYQLLARSDRPFGATLGPSLAAGPGAALRLAPGTAHGRVCVSTEPGLDLSSLTALTVRYFFRRIESAPQAGVHFQFGGEYGCDSFKSVGIWDFFGGLRIFWGGATFDVPGVLQDVGKTYYLELTFNGSVVQLHGGEAGEPASLLRMFTSSTPTVPMRPHGVEVLAIGFNARGPSHSEASHGGPHAWLDGFEVSDVVRQNPVFVCPGEKPSLTSDTRLLLNFEDDGPFLVGWNGDPIRGGLNQVLILTAHGGEQHMGNVQLHNLQFMGVAASSGPCLYDTPFSKIINCGFVAPWHGISLRGTTYGSKFEDIHGTAASIGWLQVTQSMQTMATAIKVGSAGISFYQQGAVGGYYFGLETTPYFNSYAAMYLNGGAMQIFGQVDGEGQEGPNLRACIIVDNCVPALNGMTLSRRFAGAAIRCAGGGTFNAFGGLIVVNEGSDPLVHFHQPPIRRANLYGTVNVDNRPRTNNPLYLNALDVV